MESPATSKALAEAILTSEGRHPALPQFTTRAWGSGAAPLPGGRAESGRDAGTGRQGAVPSLLVTPGLSLAASLAFGPRRHAVLLLPWVLRPGQVGWGGSGIVPGLGGTRQAAARLEPLGGESLKQQTLQNKGTSHCVFLVKCFPVF